jgi:hypothetical protein
MLQQQQGGSHVQQQAGVRVRPSSPPAASSAAWQSQQTWQQPQQQSLPQSVWPGAVDSTVVHPGNQPGTSTTTVASSSGKPRGMKHTSRASQGAHHVTQKQLRSTSPKLAAPAAEAATEEEWLEGVQQTLAAVHNQQQQAAAAQKLLEQRANEGMPGPRPCFTEGGQVLTSTSRRPGTPSWVD